MNNTYEKELLLGAAFCDHNCEMGIFQALVVLQDAMTEYFYQYDCDSVHMSKSHNAVWAVARSKVIFDGVPRWMDRLRIRAFSTKISSIAVHLNAQIETLEGEPLVRFRQDLCVIDATDHSLRGVDTTPFPLDMETPDPVLPTPCRRMKMQLGEECLVFEHTIRSSDTDMNRHMNNTAYARLIIDAFPASFWDEHRVKEFDIHYVNESREGEQIQVYRAEQEGGFAVQIKRGEDTAIRAFFLADPRERPL